MRVSFGILSSAAVLFAFGAIGLLGTWSLGVGTVLGFVGAICLVTVMEEHEHAAAALPLERVRASLEATAALTPDDG